MLTVFTILKDRSDPHIDKIQRNALQSWQWMVPEVEIIAFGDKIGAKELCDELEIRHISGIRTDESGLEYVNDAFEKAWETGKGDIFCYCNADIILPPYFSSIPLSIHAAKYVAVGQRWNTPIDQELNFKPGFWDELKSRALQTGAMHPPSGMDYFIHPKNVFALPDLRVGRYYWDNKMLELAKSNRVPIIDLTLSAFVIHQNHPNTYSGIDKESMANKALIKGDRVLSISDADYQLLKA